MRLGGGFSSKPLWYVTDGEVNGVRGFVAAEYRELGFVGGDDEWNNCCSLGEFCLLKKTR